MTPQIDYRQLPDGRTQLRARVAGRLVTSEPQAEWTDDQLDAWLAEVGDGAGRALPGPRDLAADLAVGADPHLPAAVVITCHNYGRWLGAAVESCLAQTRPPAEVVIVDDASDADTAEIVTRLAERYADRGVRVIRGEWHSVSAARDAGHAATSAPLVCQLDADDTLGPTWLAECCAALEADPQAGLAYGRAVDPDTGADIDYVRPVTDDDLRRQNAIPCCAVARREAVDRAGGWLRWAQPQVCEWGLWLRMMQLGWRRAWCPSASYGYRQHAGQMHRGWDETRRDQQVAVMRDLYRVAVVTPYCGREWALPAVAATYDRLGWERRRLHVVAVDNGATDEFSPALETVMVSRVLGYGGMTAIIDHQQAVPDVMNSELSGQSGHRHAHGREMAEQVRRIYADVIRPELPLGCDLVLTVEDDVEGLGPDLLPRLLAHLAPDVDAVGAVLRNRFGARRPLAWRVMSEDPYQAEMIEAPPAGPRAVDALGFGLTLWRAEVWRDLAPLRSAPNWDAHLPWPDHVISANIRRAGRRMILAGDVRTHHWTAAGEWQAFDGD